MNFIFRFYVGNRIYENIWLVPEFRVYGVGKQCVNNFSSVTTDHVNLFRKTFSSHLSLMTD